MSVEHPSPPELTFKEKIFAYKVPESEYNERLERLRSTWERTPVQERKFSIEKQLRAYSDLDNNEKRLLQVAFDSFESSQRSLSTFILIDLYSLPALRDEPLGLRAYSMALCAASPAALESLLRAATPFSRVADDDWAFYAAIALVKYEHAHYAQARSFIELAQLVPHHHPAIVAALLTVITRGEHRSHHCAVRALPNFLTQTETIIKTFRNADEIRPIVMPLIERLKTSPKDWQQVRDNNFYFNKLHFRAEMRHYLYDWQILGQPAPQPESPWSRLPDAVLRRMACVVPFREYLLLASTCKQYHNRMNASSVWLNVLENKWDLDVTCFDAQIPRAPVLIVQQIHELLQLNRTWWSTLAAAYPQCNLATAIDSALAPTVHSTFVVGGIDGAEISEMVWRLVNSLSSADRSGNLLATLIENGLLDFVNNTIRTDTNSDHLDLAFTVLAALYTRDRRLSALACRFMPPTLARSLGFTKQDAGDAADTAVGFAAAAMASYVLFPGVHSYAIPTCIKVGSDRVRFETDDLEIVSKSRPGEFRGAVVQPGYGSLHRSVYLASDFLDRSSPEDSQVELSVVGMDRDPTPVVDSSHAVSNLAIYHKAITDQARFFNDLDAEEAEIEPSSFSEEEFAPLPNHSVVDRFGAADAEWLLFIVFTDALLGSVVHRGILRITMEPQPQGAHDYPLEASGYWTIGDTETIDSMSKDAVFNRHQYHPEYVGQRSAISRDEHRRKELWKSAHSLQLEAATLSFDGMLAAEIERDDGTVWRLAGSGYGLGYFGGIRIDDPITQFEEIIGGFMLLKPESTAYGDSDDLAAFERLTASSLKVGPNSLPDFFPVPSEDDPNSHAEFNNISVTLATVNARALEASKLLVNSWNFNVVAGFPAYQSHKSSKYDFMFVPDLEVEHRDSMWRLSRREAGKDLFWHLERQRALVAQLFNTQAESDLTVLKPFCTLLRNTYLPQTNDQGSVLDISKSIDAAEWKKIVLIHEKWVARFCLFEVAGFDIVRAVFYTAVKLAAAVDPTDELCLVLLDYAPLVTLPEYL